MCAIHRDKSISARVCVCVRAEKHSREKSSLRGREEDDGWTQVAATKPLLLEWSHTNTPHLAINLAVSGLHCLTHIQYSLRQGVGGKNESRASGRGRKRARGRDGSMSGREDTNVLRDCKNHMASERVCVLMSMCAPSRPSSTIFAQLPWQPPSLSLCACVWGM